jgi:hypothetical protein
MSKFINYLNEKRGRSVTYEQALDFIKKNCQDAVNSWRKGYKIFRGVSSPYGEYGIIKPTTERPSANTYNFYTLIINNDPSWKQFPKRQVICTTDPQTADGYGNIYLVLPVDGAKIGICKTNDIWDSLTYKNLWADDINDEIYRIIRDKEKLIPKNIQTDFKFFKKTMSEMTRDKLKEKPLDKRNVIYSDFIDSNYKNLYDFLVKEAFTPVRNQFKVQNIKNFSIKGFNEVWTDSECVLIDIDRIDGISLGLMD